MKTRCALIQACLIGVIFFAMPASLQASIQFIFTTNTDGSLNISGYTGFGGAVVIPDMTNGLPITTIGTNAFKQATMSSVIIGTNVTGISAFAFSGDMQLTNVTIPNSVT